MQVLARRQGEVRVVLHGASGGRAGSSDLLDLLDALNESGELRYGGSRRDGLGREIVYHPA